MGDWRTALEAAAHSIEESHARHRIKYEALGLATRARTRSKLDEMPLAIEDAAQAVAIARKLADPALLVDMLALNLVLDGTDQLAAEARRTGIEPTQRSALASTFPRIRIGETRVESLTAYGHRNENFVLVTMAISGVLSSDRFCERTSNSGDWLG